MESTGHGITGACPGRPPAISWPDAPCHISSGNCVIIGITLVCVKLCGGRISDVSTDVYVGIGVVCGFMGIMINEKLD